MQKRKPGRLPCWERARPWRWTVWEPPTFTPNYVTLSRRRGPAQRTSSKSPTDELPSLNGFTHPVQAYPRLSALDATPQLSQVSVGTKSRASLWCLPAQVLEGLRWAYSKSNRFCWFP